MKDNSNVNYVRISITDNEKTLIKEFFSDLLCNVKMNGHRIAQMEILIEGMTECSHSFVQLYGTQPPRCIYCNLLDPKISFKCSEIRAKTK